MLSSHIKAIALASPRVEALPRKEYMALAMKINGLGVGAGMADGDQAFELCDYAFLGLLWSRGLLSRLGGDDAE